MWNRAIPKRIAALAAAAVCAAALAPEVRAYDEICLRNSGQIPVQFRADFKDRSEIPVADWDYSYHMRNMVVNVDFSDPDDQAEFADTYWQIWHHPQAQNPRRPHSIPPGETYCVSAEYLQEPQSGEAFAILLRTLVDNARDAGGAKEEFCQLAKARRRDDGGQEWRRVFVWPEGGGRLTFNASGSADAPQCEAAEGEHMWKGCAQGREGFRKSACYSWRPRLSADSAYDLAADETKSVAHLASAARRGANLNVRKNGELPLHAAIRLNRLDHAWTLLGQGEYLNGGDDLNSDRNRANPDLQNDDGETPLFLAAKLNRAAHVRALLKNKADAGIPDNGGRQPLMIAVAEAGSADIARMLLDSGADANAADGAGNLPLHQAVRHARLDIAKLLMRRNADAYAKDGEGKTALQHAAEGGERVEGVEGGAVDFADDDEKLAAQSAYAEMGRMLFADNLNAALERKDLPRVAELAKLAEHDWADPNIQLEGGAPALLRAYELDFPEAAVVWAGATGADLEMENAEGKRALHLAVERNHAESLRALLDNEADANARVGADGETPLQIAMRKNHREIGRALLHGGAKADAVDAKGRTPLDAATLAGNVEFEELLTRANVPRRATTKDDRAVDQPNASGQAPLHRAARRLNLNRVLTLLKRQPQVDAPDKNGHTPLMLAVRENKGDKSADVALALLNAGANPHARDKDGISPLRYAAEGNAPRLLRALLDHGVSPLDEDGAPPMWFAVWKDAGDAIRVLAEYGAPVNLAVNGNAVPADDSVYRASLLNFLGHAAHLGNAAAVRELIRAGAQVWEGGQAAREPDGFSAMERALFAMAYDVRWTPPSELNRTSRAQRARYDAVLTELALGGMSAHTRDLENAMRSPQLYPKFSALANPEQTGLAPDETPSVERVIQFIRANPNDRLGFKNILHRGAQSPDPNRIGGDGFSATHIAAATSLEALRVFFQPYPRSGWKANPNLRDDNGDSLLHWALGGKKNPANGTAAEIALFLLKRGANPNLTNNKGETPLHRAAQRGRRGAFDVLLKRGAKPEIEDEAGRTALAVSRDGRTRRALAAAIANRPDRNGRTALHLAALHEPDAVSDLLSRGLNANAQDNDGNTALMVGILVNRMSEETAKDLLAGGANFFLGNRAGDLPLHAAAARGMTGAVRALISAGARGDRRRRDGWLPLQLAAAHGGDIQPPSGADYAGTARELLRGAGADASASAPNGRAPIHLAAENGDGDLASVLLGAGADVNAMIGGDGADAGALAADVAAGRGDYETLELLLGAGAKLSNGKALAADAARGGDAVLLRLLLEGGVEGEADYYASGVSAAVGEILGEWGILDLLFAEREGGARRGHLHFAARNGDAGEVLALLGYGAAVDLEDEEGRTALHFALAGGHDEIAALLLSAGANAAAGE